MERATFELSACSGRPLRCVCTVLGPLGEPEPESGPDQGQRQGQGQGQGLSLAVTIPAPSSGGGCGLTPTSSVLVALNDVVSVFGLTPTLTVTVVRQCAHGCEGDASHARYGWRLGASPCAAVRPGAWDAQRRVLSLPRLELPPAPSAESVRVDVARCHPAPPMDAARVADLVDVTWHGFGFHLVPFALLSDVVLHLAEVIPDRPLELPGMGFDVDEARVLHRAMYGCSGGCGGGGDPQAPPAFGLADALVLWRIYDIFACLAAQAALEAYLVSEVLRGCDARTVVPLLAAHDRGGRLVSAFSAGSAAPSRADWALVVLDRTRLDAACSQH
jgi:hypothetical protein